MPQNTNGIDLAGSLEHQIISCVDKFRLCELLEVQAFTDAPSARLDTYLRRYLKRPVPFLTAHVLKVYRYTGSGNAEIHEAAATYLDMRLYNAEWYDETIASIGWAIEHLEDGTSSPLTVAYEAFLEEATRAGDQDLLDFCRSLSKS